MIVDSIYYGGLKLYKKSSTPIIKDYYYYKYQDRHPSFILINDNGHIYYEIILSNPTNNYLIGEILRLGINIVNCECFYGNRTIINTWDKLFIKDNITNELYELFIK